MTIAAIIAVIASLLAAFVAGKRSGTITVQSAETHKQLEKTLEELTSAKVEQAKERANENVDAHPGDALVDFIKSESGKNH